LGANGQLRSLQVTLGTGAYVQDEERLIELSPLPQIDILQEKAIEVFGEEVHTLAHGDEVAPTEWTEETFDQTAYSVSGWWKWKEPAEKDDQLCHLLFRLTNSNPEHLEDAEKPGDRTLSGILCADYIFSTYTIGTLDVGSKPNLQSKITVSEYKGQWTYIYFGYSKVAR
jgi:hypothetical protein